MAKRRGGPPTSIPRTAAARRRLVEEQRSRRTAKRGDDTANRRVSSSLGATSRETEPPPGKRSGNNRGGSMALGYSNVVRFELGPDTRWADVATTLKRLTGDRATRRQFEKGGRKTQIRAVFSRGEDNARRKGRETRNLSFAELWSTAVAQAASTANEWGQRYQGAVVHAIEIWVQ